MSTYWRSFWMFEGSLLDLVSKLIFFRRPFFITAKEQGDLFGRPLWMPSIEDDDHLDQLFLWTIPCHQNLFLYKGFYPYCFGQFNSCIKNLPLNTFTLAWRIYRWTILLLHEEFIVKWFYSYMKNFIIVTLDDLILAQRIYRWMILLSWLIRGFILRDLDRKSVV